ncbi:MAG: type VI secretion system tip protein VgrG [Microscillaceae bacterium]|nr:type VI secretion system tip protein VgrG [Microscillaceae bacterium]
MDKDNKNFNPLSSPTEPMDVLSFEIKIDGKTLSNATPVVSISVSKIFNKIAMIRLVILDGDPSKRTFSLSNKDDFKTGREIEILLGYHQKNETVFKGLITKHSVKSTTNQASYLYIEAKEKAVLMTLERKSTYFLEEEEVEVIRTLAKEVGLEVETIEDTKDPIKGIADPLQMVQYYCSNWDFVLMRAEANGWMVLTDDGKLKLIKPKIEEKPHYVATYGDNIFEFEGELDARRFKKKVTTQAWNYAEQAIDSVEQEFPESKNKAIEDEKNKPFQKEFVVKHNGYLGEEQLGRWAKAHELHTQLAEICGRVRVKGVALLKPGHTLQIKGIGDKFDTKVCVTGVLHQFSNNWTTDIQFGWMDDWFHKQADIEESAASGLLPGIQGLHIGLVTDVVDSKGEFRVRVKMPLISKDEEGLWARVATLDAGNQRGTFFRPEVGDEVILGFLQNDPRNAVILGGLHSSKNVAPLTNDQSKKESGFVSKNGLKMVFDDTQKSILITDGVNEISLGPQGIRIKSNTSVNVESSGTMDIKSAAVLNIKGLPVNIN